MDHRCTCSICPRSQHLELAPQVHFKDVEERGIALTPKEGGSETWRLPARLRDPPKTLRLNNCWITNSHEAQ